MAKGIDVEKSTGYVLGGVSPIGQKKKLKTIFDSTPIKHKTIYISGGKRGLEIEISPSYLEEVTNAQLANICVKMETNK